MIFDEWAHTFDRFRKMRQVFTADELKAAWLANCNPVSCARQNDDLAKGYDDANKCFTPQHLHGN